MKIVGVRYDKDHFHHKGKCVVQHKRVINGKKFLFTYVGNADKFTYKVTRLDRFGWPTAYEHTLTAKEEVMV